MTPTNHPDTNQMKDSDGTGTCKTCGKENVPDWNGKGDCITCARDKVLTNQTGLRANSKQTNRD